MRHEHRTNFIIDTRGNAAHHANTEANSIADHIANSQFGWLGFFLALSPTLRGLLLTALIITGIAWAIFPQNELLGMLVLVGAACGSPARSKVGSIASSHMTCAGTSGTDRPPLPQIPISRPSGLRRAFPVTGARGRGELRNRLTTRYNERAVGSPTLGIVW
jgi:hypothetical protein